MVTPAAIKVQVEAIKLGHYPYSRGYPLRWSCSRITDALFRRNLSKHCLSVLSIPFLAPYICLIRTSDTRQVYIGPHGSDQWNVSFPTEGHWTSPHWSPSLQGIPLAISLELARGNDIDIISGVAFKNILSFTFFIFVAYIFIFVIIWYWGQDSIRFCCFLSFQAHEKEEGRSMV